MYKFTIASQSDKMITGYFIILVVSFNKFLLGYSIKKSYTPTILVLGDRVCSPGVLIGWLLLSAN